MQPPINTYFSTKQIHKFVLFVATIIFIFSLFFETKVVNNALVQKGSFAFIIIGLVWWFIYNIMFTCLDFYVSNDRHSDSKKVDVSLNCFIAWRFILVIGFLIGLSIIF